MMLEIQKLIKRLPQLATIQTDIEQATSILLEAVQHDGWIYTCGNGGSAADAEHIAGELMKSFVLNRSLKAEEVAALATQGPFGEHLSLTLQRGIRVLPLTGMPALSTAYLNDCDPYGIFAQQVFSVARPADCLLCISTSGNSKNVIFAAIAAKARGANVVTLSGRDGGLLKDFSDVNMIVPEMEIYLIQELHLPVYHAICLELERQLYGE